MAGVHRRRCQCCQLPRAYETACGPPGPKNKYWQKISLSADSAPVYTAKTTQRLLAELWILADSPPYLPNFNSLDFSVHCIVQSEVQATPHTNLAALRFSITEEKDWLTAVQYISTRSAAHSTATGRLSWLKIMPSLNRWLASSPAHSNQYF